MLEKYSLPVSVSVSAEALLEALRHDKKADSSGVNTVFVNEIGSFDFKYLDYHELDELVREAF